MKVTLKLKNALGSKRTRNIIVLVSLQGFFMPLLQILTLETWPTPLQMCRAGVTSILQAVTMALGLYDVKVEK